MTVACAICCALAVLSLMPGTRMRHLMPKTQRRPSSRLASPGARRLLCAAVGVVTALAWGGIGGVVMGAGVAVVGPMMLGRLESGAGRRRRESLERQAAECADLLAACLASGAPLPMAAVATADALGPPVATPLRALVDALRLGADPVSAWRALEAEPSLSSIARSVARSTHTGAPLSGVLAGIADDLRRERRARAESAARSAGVRAVAPLAACFLPAFLLIGVVPVVASLALPLLSQFGG